MLHKRSKIMEEQNIGVLEREGTVRGLVGAGVVKET